MAERKMLDCRELPSEKTCSVTISGTEEEVMPLAVYHAVHDHGEEDTAELREQLHNALRGATPRAA